VDKRAVALELQAIQAEAFRLLQSVQSLTVAVLADDPEPEPAGPKCPQCGERDNLEDTSTGPAVQRMTCLACGTSFPKGANANG
jgi:hypothetical protein